MELGAFSVSLAVKDLGASRAFYEALGFEAFHGEAAQGWLILRNGAATIGLFQGMFERNILTFNPGWDADCQVARRIHRHPRDPARAEGGRASGSTMEADESTTGPASVVIVDPDGNQILFDQHV